MMRNGQDDGGAETSSCRRNGRFLSLFRFLCALIPLCLAMSCTLVAAEIDNFTSQSITFDDLLLSILPAECDGSTGAELVTFVADRQGKRQLRILTQNTARLYDPVPTTAAELPASVFGVQIIDFDGDRQDEILLLGFDGVYLLETDGGNYSASLKTVALFDRLFAVPDPSLVVPYRFVFDLNEDNTMEFVVPCWQGARIFQKRDAGYVLAGQLAVNYRLGGAQGANFLRGSNFDGFSFKIPELAVYDINTDKVSDVLVETAAGLAVFYQTGNLTFRERPNLFLEVKPSLMENLCFSSSGLADINNDGLVDYCRVFTQGESDEYKSIIEIFFGNIQEGFSTRPSKRIVINEYAVGLALIDLDGDAVSSLVVATIPVSPARMVKAMLVKKMPVQLQIFEAQGALMGDQPVMVKTIPCAMDLFKRGAPARYIGCLAGDFDRDARNDLVVVDDDKEMQIYKGGKNPLFADKALITRKVGDVTSLASCDLNGDQKDDLIVLGRDEEGKETVTLLWTK